MKLCDVNVLVYAHRSDSTPDHEEYAKWLIEMVTGPEAFGISETVLSNFVRVVTNPRIFKQPTSVDDALLFCERLLNRPQAVVLRPTERNWEIFAQLCRTIPARGKLVADAWHAALAIEYGCEWMSCDSDFARFEGLKWRHPLAG